MAKRKKNRSEFPLTFFIMMVGIIIIALLNPDNFLKPFIDMSKSLGVLLGVICIAFIWDHLSHR